jgi:hypothetical protein
MALIVLLALAWLLGRAAASARAGDIAGTPDRVP